MKPKKHIIDVPVYEPGKPIEEVKREYQLDEVIKLASNENPFGPSPLVQQAMREEFSELAVYPDGYAAELREAVAHFYHIDQNQLIFGNGSDEIVQFICRTFLSPDTNTVMATPSFAEYKINALIEGAEIIEVPLKDGVHDLEAMSKRVNQRTRVVWVCNPNNPSGTYVPHDALANLLESLPSDVLVVVDEAYYEYVTAKDYPDSLALLDKHSNVLILRTFSKVYGLAALRIGYGIGHPDLINHLNKVRAPFNTSRVAQKAAIAALRDQAYMRQCVQRNRAGKEQFYAAFQQLGLSYFPTEANFIMVDVNRPAHQCFEALLKQGIIVRSGEALGYPTSLRITIGTEAQNERIIHVLERMVQHVS